MSDRGDRADDAEGGILIQGDAIAPAEGVGAHRFHARYALGTDDELVDLMFEPTDPGLFQLLAAELLGLVFADAANAVDGFLAVVEISRFERLLSLCGRGHRLIDTLKNT